MDRASAVATPPIERSSSVDRYILAPSKVTSNPLSLRAERRSATVEEEVTVRIVLVVPRVLFLTVTVPFDTPMELRRVSAAS